MYNVEPKYFIYAQEVQVGPLAKSQLIDAIESQNLGHDAYVWEEGMADWIKLSDYSDLSEYVQYLPKVTNLSNLKRQNKLYSKLSDEVFNSPINATQFIDTSVSRQSVSQVQSGLKHFLEACKNIYHAHKYYVLTAGFVVLAASVVTLNYVNRPSIWEQIEATPEQLKEVKWTLAQTTSSTAYFSAVALKGDMREPQFAIATNLPDQTRLTVQYQGIRSTLAGAMSSQLQTEVIVSNGFAVTNKLRRQDGAFLPAGAYKVKITCESCASDTEQKSIWLSYPLAIGVMNSEYQSNVLEFHKLMRTQAESELQELSEMYKFLYQVIADRLNKKTLSSQQQIMFQQLSGILREYPVDRLAEHNVLHFIYRDLLAIYEGLEQMPANLGDLRRALDQLQIKHRQAQQDLNTNFRNVLDTI